MSKTQIQLLESIDLTLKRIAAALERDSARSLAPHPITCPGHNMHWQGSNRCPVCGHNGPR